MKQVQLRIQSNVEIADNVFCMVMEGDVGAITAPGQFINIRIGGKFLRRPISVCDVDTVATGTKRIEKEAAEAFGSSLYNTPETWNRGRGGDTLSQSGSSKEALTAGITDLKDVPADGDADRSTAASGSGDSAQLQNDCIFREIPPVEGTVTILYKVVGEGTKALAACRRDEVLDVLTGLGNGFDIRFAGDAPLLIGGGIGSAPMMMLAKQLISDGVRPTALLGFRGKQDMILQGDLYEIGCDVYVATEDGSYGRKGFVTDLMEDLKQQGLEFSYFYACGPSPMLHAVYRASGNLDGQLSFEERMGCGFGACMGCSLETKNGPKRVCKDGPVFLKSELNWD